MLYRNVELIWFAALLNYIHVYHDNLFVLKLYSYVILTYIISLMDHIVALLYIILINPNRPN